MMLRRTIVSLIACLVAVPVSAAAPAAAPAKATAGAAAVAPTLPLQQIVDRNIAARGGLPAWQRVQTLSMSGKLDAGKERKDGGLVAELAGFGPQQAQAVRRARARDVLEGKAPKAAISKTIQLPFRIELKRPLKARFEYDFQGQVAAQVYDGKNGWKVRPYLGRHEVEPFTTEETQIAASQQELDGPLINYAAKGTKVALAGTEMVEGNPTYKLTLTLKNGEVRHLWIDAKTFLDTKIEGFPRHWDGKSRMLLTYYRDYKSVDGLMIPYRLETVVDGAPVSDTIYVEKVTVNPALADSRFAKPL